MPIANGRTTVSQPIGPVRSKRLIAFRTPGITIPRESRNGHGSAAGRLIPPFDAKRVEAIQTAIDAGRFEPHPEVIADKLIENADELLSRKS